MVDPLKSDLPHFFQHQQYHNGYCHQDDYEGFGDKELGHEHQGGGIAPDGTSKVCGMPNVSQPALHAVYGVQQIGDPQYIGRQWNRDEHDPQAHVRVQKNGRIKDAGDRPTGPHGTVMGFVPMKEKGQKASAHQTDKINDQKLDGSQPIDHHIGKEIQGEHIEEKVGNVHVKKAGSEHAFLLSRLDSPDVELIPFKKSNIVEPPDGNQDICRQNGYGGHM